jgi:hypothetical protein
MRNHRAACIAQFERWPHHAMKLFALGVLLAVISGCASNPAAAPARIVANRETPVLLCWFVACDDAGRHGYAAWDGRLGQVEPNGGGLFNTLPALRAAIQSSGATNASIEPSYPGAIPVGWQIRGLTPEELRVLR